MSVRRNFAATACIALGAILPGCAPSEEALAADRAEIERLVAAYAELLETAYRSGDPTGIGTVSTEREVARVGARIRELAELGRELRPALQSQVIEEVDRFGATSASVTTIEVWDLRIVAMGSEEPVAESIDQENRVVYILRKERGSWEILSRLRKSSAESP